MGVRPTRLGSSGSRQGKQARHTSTTRRRTGWGCECRARAEKNTPRHLRTPPSVGREGGGGDKERDENGDGAAGHWRRRRWRAGGGWRLVRRASLWSRSPSWWIAVPCAKNRRKRSERVVARRFQGPLKGLGQAGTGAGGGGGRPRAASPVASACAVRRKWVGAGVGTWQGLGLGQLWAYK